MDTDEYQISISREVALCRRLIGRLERAIGEREQRFGMSTEDFLRGLDQRRWDLEDPEFRDWREDHLELLHRRRQLSGYLDGLEALKHR